MTGAFRHLRAAISVSLCTCSRFRSPRGGVHLQARRGRMAATEDTQIATELHSSGLDSEMIVQTRCYARVGLVGNPSDGYHGKTIAFTMRNFWAEAVLYESPELELRPGQQDHAVFGSLSELVANVRSTGYYGGIRLMKATVKKFAEYCEQQGIELPRRNFTLRYESNIPRQVGLGGSSAIITAGMRALMGFFGVEIPSHILPNVVLAAETQELNLSAGLQDRVVQAYEGLVYMDFDRDFMDAHGYGRYERLDPGLLCPLYVAYRTGPSQESGMAHLRVRELYEMGDKTVMATLKEIASLADAAKELLVHGRAEELTEVMNRNFDLRAQIFTISAENMDMVRRARSCGASCKFCGAGGAVVGTYDSQETLRRLRQVMQEGGYKLVLPEVRAP